MLIQHEPLNFDRYVDQKIFGEKTLLKTENFAWRHEHTDRLFGDFRRFSKIICGADHCQIFLPTNPFVGRPFKHWKILFLRMVTLNIRLTNHSVSNHTDLSHLVTI